MSSIVYIIRTLAVNVLRDGMLSCIRTKALENILKIHTD